MTRLALATALVVSCQQKSVEHPPEESPRTPQPKARLTEVELGHGVNSAHQIEQPVYEFSPTDTVWASVKTENAPAGTLVQVKWIYMESGHEELLAEDSQTAVTGTGYTYFFIANVGPWPVGTYEFRVGIADGPTARRSFNMKEPGAHEPSPHDIKETSPPEPQPRAT